ncbi:ATP-binding cassette domain-containing protein [Paenibacillus eucommiae]|uniref:ABC transport system ATP-binding protein n=1 Tax=Paenibacillus eucommiae TaxID=1355755 RepID=A0ABS4J7K1_9BACL|nr:ABC transporter ATP-binding protein [Paenibacillus eucommiae]MBP1995828.1 putative ABC transport system ATP-binding protein [Paenibacillus eucommiae]
MIELNDISKSFDGKSVLSNFSLTINENEIVSIVGSSGAGKTTVLNLIGLLDRPDDGIVKIASYINPTKRETMFLRRYTFGYIFQNYLLMDNETVLKNLLISKTYNNEFSEQMLISTLERVGLNSTFLNKKVYQLSGGEQQRIAIARVMLKPSKIILADEPTGNLDRMNKEVIVSLFRELQGLGKTIVCVTHDKEIASKSDRVININGKGDLDT